jgi:hypothetical protein
MFQLTGAVWITVTRETRVKVSLVWCDLTPWYGVGTGTTTAFYSSFSLTLPFSSLGSVAGILSGGSVRAA